MVGQAVCGANGRAGGVSNKLTADISSLPCSLPSGSTSGSEQAGSGEERAAISSAGAGERARGERSFLPRICKLNNKYRGYTRRAARSAFTQLALSADWSHRLRGDGDIHSPSLLRSVDLLCTRTRAHALNARAR